jgi:methanogenic corrinoid protein MtbC1
MPDGDGGSETVFPANGDLPSVAGQSAGGHLGRGQDWHHPAVRVANLIRTIETEVVPRLVLAGRATAVPVADTNALAVSESDIADYADKLTLRDPSAAAEIVARLQSRGASPEALFVDLLTPAARRLGVLWEDDLCDFTQVTVGVIRLEQVVHALSPAFLSEARRTDLSRRILLAPAPDEQHTFGLVMIGEFFRRAGWHVWGGAGAGAGTPTELVAMVAFSVVGLTAGTTAVVDRLALQIHGIRRASCNPDVGILVGGPLFLEHPELVARVGADATAADGRQAVRQAEALHALRLDRV